MTQKRIQLESPHVGQISIIRGADRFNVIMCGRRFGKTSMGQGLVVAPAIEGGPTAWFAPTSKILREPWEWVKNALAPIIRRTNEQEHKVWLTTGGTIDFWSLNKPDSGRGRKYQRIIVDEGGLVCGLSKIWNYTLRPTLADMKGDAWFLGTPKGRGDFYRLYRKGEQGDEGWASFQRGTADNPYIDPEEIKAARREIPEEAFRQEFLGHPSDDAGNPFGIQHIQSCSGEISSEPAVCFGVDLAKSYDWSVVIGLDSHGRVCYFDRWQGDWRGTIERVNLAIGDVPALIDWTGVGDPIVEEISRRKTTAAGYKFTSESKQILMEGLAVAVQSRSITIPDGHIRSEMELFEYSWQGGRVRYSAPQGLHDDCVCALALAVRVMNNAKSVGSVGALVGNAWRGWS